MMKGTQPYCRTVLAALASLSMTGAAEARRWIAIFFPTKGHIESLRTEFTITLYFSYKHHCFKGNIMVLLIKENGTKFKRYLVNVM